jgi:predicted nucleic acid-binding protein
MKIALDTDVLLDVALKRPPFFESSAGVLRWAEQAPGRAAVAWHSLSNVAYLVRPDARGFLTDLLRFTEVAPTGTDAARQALGLTIKDLEDALQVAAALAFGATCLVTRNVRLSKGAPVEALSPEAFLARVSIG